MDERDELILSLQAQVADLQQKLEFALSQLSKQSVKKDSTNSSLSPSRDLARKTKSLRGKSSRKPGGQPGHQGSTLKMVAHPDKVEELKPSFCQVCGCAFQDHSLSHHTSRQFVDIPLPKPVVTEYRQYAGRCRCGHHQKASFPAGLNAPVQYGGNVRALVGYFSVGQYIPYQRLTEGLSVKLSQGTVDNLLKGLAQKALPYYEEVRQKLENSHLPVGSDETGCRVDRQNHWGWVWQNKEYCYLAVSSSRGWATVKKHFPRGFKRAALSSDRWAAQLKTSAQNHQICLALYYGTNE